MHEIKTDLSGADLERAEAIAESLGMSLSELVSLAASAELHRRYVRPKREGRVLAFGRRREGE